MNNIESPSSCDASGQAAFLKKCRLTLSYSLVSGSIALTGCGKAPEGPAEETQPIVQKQLPSAGLPQRKVDTEWAAATDLAARKALVSNRTLAAEDADVAEMLDTLRAQASQVELPGLLLTFYEELDLRPPVVRLPLLLELARETALDESLRTSILAELGAALNADHGHAWDAWAATLERHLKDAHGLLDRREPAAD